MGKGDLEKQDRMRKEFEDWILETSNSVGRVVDLSYIHRHFVPEISYSTLAPLSRGDRLPSWENAIILMRARPAFAQILELPELLPEEITKSPLAMAIVRMLASPALTDDDLAKVRAYIEQIKGSATTSTGTHYAA